jgi:hypothetical protein
VGFVLLIPQNRSLGYRAMAEEEGTTPGVRKDSLDEFLGDLESTLQDTTPLAGGGDVTLSASLSELLGTMGGDVDLAELLKSSNDDFSDIFGDSPGRTKGAKSPKASGAGGDKGAAGQGPAWTSLGKHDLWCSVRMM